MITITDEIQSIEQRCNALFEDAFKICFEDNPKRIGWELHGINSSIIITNNLEIATDKYYLIEIYLSDKLQDILYNIVEGFTMWVDTYKSGRTSLYNILNYYTPENLEKYLSEYEDNLLLIKEERSKFIRRQK